MYILIIFLKYINVIEIVHLNGSIESLISKIHFVITYNRCQLSGQLLTARYPLFTAAPSAPPRFVATHLLMNGVSQFAGGISVRGLVSVPSELFRVFQSVLSTFYLILSARSSDIASSEKGKSIFSTISLAVMAH